MHLPIYWTHLCVLSFRAFWQIHNLALETYTIRDLYNICYCTTIAKTKLIMFALFVIAVCVRHTSICLPFSMISLEAICVFTFFGASVILVQCCLVLVYLI